MKISVNNIDRLLRAELSKKAKFVDIKDNPRGVFLQWATPEVGDLFDKQTVLIEKAIKKKIPIIIFDKYQDMTADEISFLVREGAFLWEPAVSDRNFFSFQPVWGNIPTNVEDIPWNFDESRGVDLANLSTLVRRMPTFEKYYVPVHEIGDFGVFYANVDQNKTIYNKVDAMGIPIVPSYDGFMKDVKMTVLAGTEQDYKNGHLDPNLFTYLENGVVPLLPSEHRWYHSVFKDLTIYGEDNIEFFLRTYDKTAFGSIYDVYCNLAENLPEADVINVSKRILTFFK
jgi:hypothetical protein